MAEMSYQTALTNIQNFNSFKQNDAVGNFADLRVDENQNIVHDTSTCKAARFAATFFSLGLSQRYRNENKEHSLGVQKVLKLSVTTLLTTKDLSLRDKTLCEQALTTYYATLFESRSLFFPPPCLARFYYWVLGVHNLLITRTAISFSPRSQAKIEALGRAVQGILEQPPAPMPLLQERPNARLALEFTNNLSSLVQEHSAEIGQVLAPIQQKYIEFFTHVALEKEKFDAQECGFATVSQFNESKTQIERIQNKVVKDNFDAFVPVWAKADRDLAKAAADAGYIRDEEASNVIDAYYAYLKAHANEADFIRRTSQAAMFEIVEEVSHAFNMELYGNIANKKLPEAFIFIFTNMLNDLDNLDHKKITILTFRYLSIKINDKLSQRYANELKGEEKVLIEYQALMLAIQVFAVNAKVLFTLKPLLQKFLKHFAQSEEMGPDPFGLEIPAEEPQDRRFISAFSQYATHHLMEQRVRLNLMKQAAQSATFSLTEKDYYQEIQKVLNYETKEYMVPTQSSIFGMLKNLKRDMMQLGREVANLDINDLGIIMTKPDPLSRQLAEEFMNQFLSDLVSFALHLPLNIFQYIEEIEGASSNTLEYQAQSPSLLTNFAFIGND